MITLHAYVLRELLKTFGLAILALTALFTMGGGLYNVVRSPGVTAASLLSVLPLLLPIVITLTMPVSALFAATMVYGRLAADNELLACRAAGVNVHRTFLSAVLLSVFVTVFTLLFGNFVIPDFMKRLDRFARTNIRDIALQQLRSQGHVRYGNRYFMTAERVEDVDDAALREKGLPTGREIRYLLIASPTFLQLDGNGEVERFATARWGLCQFDTRAVMLRVTVYVSDAQNYEIGKQFAHIDLQKVGPVEIDLPMPLKPSMLDLKTLLRWYDAPWESAKMQPRIEKFLIQLGRYRFYADCAQRLGRGEKITLQDDQGWSYQVEAERCTFDGKRPVLVDARVEMRRPGQPRPTRYEAPRAVLIARALPDGQPIVEIRLEESGDRPVLEYNPRADDYDTPREKPTLSLDGLQVPQRVLDEMKTYTPAAVLNPEESLPIEGELVDARVKLWASAAKLQRKIAALVHFRLGYASSALVIILMGAALGVIFRGARMLAAFGLACIPFGSVTILMVMGRQLGEHEGTEAVGAAIIWGGLLLTAVADGFIIRFGVRR